MFTKAELIQNWQQLIAAEPLPLRVVYFGHADFTSSCSEQSIWAIQGRRGDFTDTLLFWVKAMEETGWISSEPYCARHFETARCQPLDVQAFRDYVADY